MVPGSSLHFPFWDLAIFSFFLSLFIYLFIHLSSYFFVYSFIHSVLCLFVNSLMLVTVQRFQFCLNKVFKIRPINNSTLKFLLEKRGDDPKGRDPTLSLPSSSVKYPSCNPFGRPDIWAN